MKADYEHLRYIIQNDHCYTPYTHVDSLTEGKPGGTTDVSKNDTKTKLKLPITSAQNLMSKKLSRSSQSSKLTALNGLDKDISNPIQNRSLDDANSSTENNADRTSDEEEIESETDFSETSDSESDNDRDSDLDFSVNDCHSRRAKKIKKRKIQAKRLASKKRRRSTIELAASDDGSTLNRKKSIKLPRKLINTSSKSLNATSLAMSIASKLPTASSAPRITKVSYIKETTTSQNDAPIKAQSVQKTNNITIPQATATMKNEPKSSNIIVKPKEKKAQTENVLLSDMSSLFTPDVIKKNSNENIVSINKSHSSTVVGKSTAVEFISKPLTQAIQTITTQTPRIATTPKLVKSPAVVFRKVPKSSINLASEQDKQLDLIDSLLQEELRKSEPNTIPTSASQTVIPAAIPNIVKMLETSETTSSLGNTDFSQPSSTSNTMPITYSTAQVSHDAQMLPDDLLESFVNSDYLSDDLMQHVVKLVEDKNLQEVIDQQVLGVRTMPSATLPHPQIQTTLSVPKLNIHAQITDQTPTKLPDEHKSIVKTPTTSTLVTPTSVKEGIKVKRADGRIITLPPIEAPTTRGAKRRAETTLGPEIQKKQKVFTVIVQTEPHSQNQQKNQPTVTVPPNSLLKGNPIAVRERRASVAVKRASLESKPRRSLSISNPPITGGDEDDDEEEDGSDGSYNSEDDPHR